jgi:hypothetical protein
LAPLYNLDPVGFSAYKFLTNHSIELLMNEPDRARLNLRRRRNKTDESQMTIDFSEGNSDA